MGKKGNDFDSYENIPNLTFANQNKDDKGKSRLDLVPITDMWIEIAKVREYGCKKYPNTGIFV